MITAADIAFEDRKIRWVTIGFVLLSIYRSLSVAAGQFIYNGYNLPNEDWAYLAGILILLIMLLFKKKTTAVAFLTAIFYVKFETVFGSGSVSTALLIHFCYFLGMWNWLKNKYQLLEPENAGEANIILNKLYWMLFAGYGVINALSGFIHWADPFWRNGNAMELIASNAYMGRFFEFFRELRIQYPKTMDFLFAVNTYGVIISQILLAPLYLFRIGRKLLFIWFIILLIHIFLILRIVLLPHFTLLLFILLFYTKTQPIYGFRLIKPDSNYGALNRFMGIGYAIFIMLFLLKTPAISKGTDKVFWFFREWETKVWFNRRVSQLGLGQPDILNRQFLTGSRRFLIMHKNPGKTDTLNIMGTKGERLQYLPDPLFIEHQGLEAIYGNVGAHVVAYDSFTYMNSPTPYKWKGRAVERIIRIDYFVKGRKGKHEYEVEFWERKKPHKNGVPSWDYTDTMVEIRKYEFDGKTDLPLRMPVTR
jgi:hypothetical protein